MSVSAVLVLNDFCHVQGGASKIARDEAIALARAGIRTIFLGAAGPVDPALTAAGVRVVCLHQPALTAADQPVRAAALAVWNAPAHAKTRDLLAALDRRTTIVHLHGYTKALSAAPLSAAVESGFSALCTLHDFFAACPNGAFFDYRLEAPCALTALGPRCLLRNCDKRHPAHKAYRVVRAVSQRFAAGFPRRVRDYITLSRRSAELLRPYLPADARLWPLRNLVDVPHAPAVDVARNRALVVIGRLEAEKGVTLAAEAARRLEMPITFAGDGPLRAELEALGARVTGWLPPESVLEVLEAARCLVFPSRWYETYGMAVDEAAARGVPAVVSDVSAPAERVVPGGTGWVFASGDAGSLADALAPVRSDARVRAAGEAAYVRFWADAADPTRHVRELLAIYQAVLGEGSADHSNGRMQ